MMLRKLLFAALAHLALLAPAIAQTSSQETFGPGPGYDAYIATGANTVRTAPAYAAQVQDVRNFFAGTSANCATDVSPAVTAAVAAGVTNLWLPKNCIYIPPSNAIPANITITGEDWQSSQIQSSSPTTLDVTVGAHTLLKNLMVQGFFCYASVVPFNTAKSCPLTEFKNVSDFTVTLANWSYEQVMVLGPTVTPPGSGSSANDTPGIAITQLSQLGDGLYCQVGNPSNPANGANCERIVPAGNGDYGIYMLPGLINTTTNQHYSIFIKNLDYNTSGAGIYIDRVGNGTDVTPSLRVDDNNAAAATSTQNVMTVNLNNQTSGDYLSLYQGITAFTGNFLDLQAGNASGSFNSGNFLKASINGSVVALISNTGLMRTNPGFIGGFKNNGSIPTSANFAIEQTQFLAAGDTSAYAIVHESVITSGASAVFPTTDGTGTLSTSNCGNLASNNMKATVKDIAVTITDVTAPANGYTWYMPVGHLARFTGVGTTTWQGGTPVAFTDGALTYTVAISADTTNACPKISVTPPGGNTDTLHIMASFNMDRVQ